TGALPGAARRASAARAPLALVVCGSLWNRHSASVPVVRVLAFLRDRRRALLFPSPALRPHRALDCQLLFLRSLERVVRSLLVDLDCERLRDRDLDRGRQRAATAQYSIASWPGRDGKSRLLGKLQIRELCKRHGGGPGRDAPKSVARQSLRSDRHQLLHLPKHFVSR